MSETTRQKTQARQAGSKSAKEPAEYALYIMRHGKAVRGGPPYSDDAKRPLTAQGVKDLQTIAKGMIRLGVTLDWIVSSPLVRAKETAQVIAESFAPKLPVEISEALSPGGSTEALLAVLGKQPARTSTLLIGHEPGLSELSCRLIGAGHDANVGFKKGGCCLITFSGAPLVSGGHLLWWLTPRVLRKMA